MDKIVIASMRRSAGKTSIIAGIGTALKKRVAYMKPLGDRLLYRKKRLWDYDTALMTALFNLGDNPEQMSIGFDHSKLRYMYDEKGIRTKVLETLASLEKDKDVLFLETGGELTYGCSVHLDAIGIAKHVGGKLIIVAGGEENTVLDQVTFLKKHVGMNGVNFGGIIVNKVHNIDEFKATHAPKIAEMGVNLIGVLPYQEALTNFSVNYLAEQLFARVITGEGGLKKIAKTMVIGAMSANDALRSQAFKKENKVVITGGDRSDMILAALESNSVCVVLTNNILPPSNIISKAAELDVPLLLVPFDTYETAKKIENIEPLLTREDGEKIELLGRLVKENLDLGKIIGP